MTRTDWMLFLLVALLTWYIFHHMIEPMAQAQWAYLETTERVEAFHKILQGVK